MNPVKPLLPRVIKVLPLENYQLLLQFQDESIKRFDVRPYLDYPAFKRLTAAGLFSKAHVQHGTVVWDEMLDLAPETLYLLGVPETSFDF